MQYFFNRYLARLSHRTLEILMTLKFENYGHKLMKISIVIPKKGKHSHLSLTFSLCLNSFLSVI